MQPVGKILIVAGVILVGAGLLFLFVEKIPWFGKLPGDITVKRDNFTFHFPLATCLVVSVIVSLFLWFFRK